eukprot:Transcript_11901.p1 GENE.Transcript_11901~~Transcript_11901.p1  ORF type:complete len:360 (-),score=42.81 Transcript_11901:101-1180(-)
MSATDLPSLAALSLGEPARPTPSPPAAREGLGVLNGAPPVSMPLGGMPLGSSPPQMTQMPQPLPVTMPMPGGPIPGPGPIPGLTQPNPENKLFVGGAPPGTDEETLKKIFEEHGEVEEVFLMRGGSRSGQACAFVRFVTPEGAIAAIQAVHGKYVMPGCTDPLVVRYADAPGSRAKKKGGGAYGGYGPGPYGFGYPGMASQGGWGAGPYGGAGWPGGPGMGFGGYPGGGPFMPYPNGMGMAPGMAPGMAIAPSVGTPPQALAGGLAQPQQAAAFAGAGFPGAANDPARGGPQPQMPTPTVISGRPVEGAPDWAAYTAPDGRTYYYNAKTGVSSWEKPGPAPQPAPASQAGGPLGGAFGY